MKWYLLSLLLVLCGCSTPSDRPDTQEDNLLLPLDLPSGANTSLPHLFKGGDDRLYLSWVEQMDSSRVMLKYSTLIQGQWSTPEHIASGDNWFVNWADYPIMAVDSQDNKIAHYLQKSSAGTYSYDVHVVVKHKDSTNWSDSIIPHTDHTPTEHGFVTLLPQNDNTFLLAWLDGRNTGSSDDGHHHGTNGAMTLRSAIIDLEGNITGEVELDNRVCDCCQTGGTSTTEETVLVYRDRSVDEIRDMSFTSFSNGVWSEPTKVFEDNWNIEGCPVNGPRIASFEQTVGIAWFTAALNRPVVKVAFKQEDGFSEPIVVDPTMPLGRVDIAMINGTSALVSWMDGGNQPQLKYRIIGRDGTMSQEQVVADMSGSRGSGFPQMEVMMDTAYFIWTDYNETTNGTSLDGLKISLNALL